VKEKKEKMEDKVRKLEKEVKKKIVSQGPIKLRNTVAIL